MTEDTKLHEQAEELRNAVISLLDVIEYLHLCGCRGDDSDYLHSVASAQSLVRKRPSQKEVATRLDKYIQVGLPPTAFPMEDEDDG